MTENTGRKSSKSDSYVKIGPRAPFALQTLGNGTFPTASEG
jgi:hypothetical protein